MLGTFRILVLVVVALVALGACSAGSLGGLDSTVGDVSESTAPPPDAGWGGGAEGGDGQAGVPEAPADEDLKGSDGERAVALFGQVLPAGRDIIRRGSVVIAVDDVATTALAAASAIERLGGFVFGQSSVVSPEAVTVITFKVPPPRFGEALTVLADLGELRSQTISADDVTERVVDLRSRITTSEASVERLRGLIAEATNIEDLVALERELASREADLESLRGQLRTLEDAVALATIDLTIGETFARPGLSVLVTGYPLGTGDDVGAGCPGTTSVSVEEGDDAAICIEVRNTGDTPLGAFEVVDTVLGVGLGDLVVVFGDPGAPLEPGQSLMLAHPLTVDRSIQTRTRVTATPLDPDGGALSGRTVGETAALGVTAVRPTEVPGFSAGLAASLDAVVWLWRAAVLAVGLALPFVVIIGAVVGLVWLAVRRRPRRTVSGDATLAAVSDASPVDQSGRE